MLIPAHLQEKLVDIGIRHIGLAEEEFSSMSEKERYYRLKNAYVSPVLLFQTTPVEIERLISSDTKHLMQACELTAVQYKNAWDVQRMFVSSRDLDNINLLNDIAKQHDFADDHDFINTLTKCQCFISLTYGFKDYFFSTIRDDGEYPLQTLQGLMRLYTKVWKHHGIPFDEKGYDRQDTNIIDMIHFFSAQNTLQALQMGWW